MLGSASLVDEPTFVSSFVLLLGRVLRLSGSATTEAMEVIDAMRAASQGGRYQLSDLFVDIGRLIRASTKPLVLFIDEVDGATNHQVFLDFLGMLHQASTGRDTSGTPALRSVILAGVTDVSRLRPKTRLGDQREPGGLWNNAVDCGVDLSFSAKDVAGMLADYALDHAIGMDVDARAAQICDYTGGHPFLVSRT